MKDSVLVNMNIWQLARFCECLEIYRDVANEFGNLRDDEFLGVLREYIREWVSIHEYTSFVISDIAEALLRMWRVPHMAQKYVNLVVVLDEIAKEV